MGYIQGVESDILLLDISNNYEYIWTTTFEPLPLTSPLSTLNTHIIFGAFMGSIVIFGILLSGSFFAYKWYINRKKQNNTISTSGDKRLLFSKKISNSRRNEITNSRSNSASNTQPVYSNIRIFYIMIEILMEISM